MTQGYDDFHSSDADAALDILLVRWAEVNGLAAAGAERIYRAIVVSNQDLSAQWFLDLMRHMNYGLSQVLRSPSSVVALQVWTTANRSRERHQSGQGSPKRMTTYRPYLQLPRVIIGS